MTDLITENLNNKLLDYYFRSNFVSKRDVRRVMHWLDRDLDGSLVENDDTMHNTALPRPPAFIDIMGTRDFFAMLGISASPALIMSTARSLQAGKLVIDVAAKGTLFTTLLAEGLVTGSAVQEAKDAKTEVAGWIETLAQRHDCLDAVTKKFLNAYNYQYHKDATYRIRVAIYSYLYLMYNSKTEKEFQDLRVEFSMALMTLTAEYYAIFHRGTIRNIFEERTFFQRVFDRMFGFVQRNLTRRDMFTGTNHPRGYITDMLVKADNVNGGSPLWVIPAMNMTLTFAAMSGATAHETMKKADVDACDHLVFDSTIVALALCNFLFNGSSDTDKRKNPLVHGTLYPRSAPKTYGNTGVYSNSKIHSIIWLPTQAVNVPKRPIDVAEMLYQAAILRCVGILVCHQSLANPLYEYALAYSMPTFVGDKIALSTKFVKNEVAIPRFSDCDDKTSLALVEVLAELINSAAMYDKVGVKVDEVSIPRRMSGDLKYQSIDLDTLLEENVNAWLPIDDTANDRARGHLYYY